MIKKIENKLGEEERNRIYIFGLSLTLLIILVVDLATVLNVTLYGGLIHLGLLVGVCVVLAVIKKLWDAGI